MSTTETSHVHRLLEKYNQPGPRYTSYPTAPVWKSGFNPETYKKILGKLHEFSTEPVSIYVHIPFCEERCLYCACNVTVRSDHSVAKRFLDHFEKEVGMVAESLGFKPTVRQLHLGGGTPTYLSPDEIRRLMKILGASFELDYLRGENSVEIDPVVTTLEHIEALTEEGFSRFSFGVQDFNPQVQEAVRRIQSFEDTYKMVQQSRERGVKSINVDLIYGLPYQTPESFIDTLKKTLLLNPERLALFSYAHVPWIHKHQQVLDNHPRPDASAKLDLLMIAKDFLENNGLRLIGMDHFAKPDDELSIALDEGRLRRNFMGYTTLKSDTILAFGNSAIGYIGGTYVQNEKNLKEYEGRIDAGGLPTESGYTMTREDRIRKSVIMDLMIQFAVFYDEFNQRTGHQFEDYFSAELAGMNDLIADGLVERFPDRLVVTDTGELFVRNVAMRFDQYLSTTGETPRFSQTV